MRTPHKGTLWGELDTLESRWEVLVKMREQEIADGSTTHRNSETQSDITRELAPAIFLK